MSETNGYMTRDQWLEPDPREYKDLEIDGRKIRIRSLSEGDNSKIQAPNFTKDGKVNLEKSRDTRLRTIAESVVNEHNDTFLTFSDVASMRQKDKRFIDRVYSAIADFSGLENDVEGAEKN